MNQRNVIIKALAKAGLQDQYSEMLDCGAFYNIIFDHEFAKVLWGKGTLRSYSCGHVEKAEYDSEGWPIDEHICKEWSEEGGSAVTLPAWQFHLQRMVVEPDPILYLERFILNL